jgi:hypothetical protein
MKKPPETTTMRDYANHCDQQVLGNEVHVLLHCPIFKDSSDAIIKHISYALDTFSQSP